MNTANSSIQLTLSPDTVYTTSVAGQFSFASFTLSVTNTSASPVQVSSVAILLPANLYLEGSLSSVTTVADNTWNFSAVATPGAFEASPVSGNPVVLAAGTSFTFVLNNVTVAQQTGTVNDVEAMVRLSDGTRIRNTFTVNIAQATPAISFFTAEPTYITPGQSATLSWECTGMTYCILSPPANNNELSASGSANVSPETSTTYTLDAYATNLHLQAQVNVQVQRPQVVTFSAASNSVNYNGYVFLNWETLNADSVQLTAVPQVDNLPTNLPVNTAGNGIEVGPLTQATAFILTPVSNTIPGSVSSPLSIDINPATASFSASPDTNVWQQDELTLTWNITNAATVTLTPPLDGGPSLQNLSGSMVIHPESDVNYVLTVTGAPNTPQVVQTVSFSVTPVTVDFSASPNPVSPLSGPNQTTLSWNVQAQVMSINQGIGNIPAAGQQVLTKPVNGTTYILTAGTVQNPDLINAGAIIVNQFGPFPFTEFTSIVNNQDLYITYIVLNASPGFSSPDYFVVQLENVALPSPANPALITPGGEFCLMCELGTTPVWVNGQNQGTVTILGISQSNQ